MRVVRQERTAVKMEPIDIDDLTKIGKADAFRFKFCNEAQSLIQITSKGKNRDQSLSEFVNESSVEYLKKRIDETSDQFRGLNEVRVNANNQSLLMHF